jgi:hypothetical protein
MLLFSLNTFVFSTSKNFRIKIYKTIILSVVRYDCEIMVSYTKGGTQAEGI